MRYVAEARFFRAWNYWMLFRLYGGVPIIKEVPDIDSEVLYSARASRKETVDFILQDLSDATAHLPLKSTLSSEDVGRITKGAALALKGRVALFEGTWGKYRGDNDVNDYFDIAIESSNTIINSGEYSLYNGSGAESYRYLFIEEGDDSPENDFVSSNGLDMKREIRRERTVEMALEGYRYDDLRRWKIAENELPQAIKGIKIVGTQWGTDPIIVSGDDKNLYLKEEYQKRTDEDGFLIAEPAEDRYFDPAKHYLRPLPTKEININDQLEQNPGW